MFINVRDVLRLTTSSGKKLKVMGVVIHITYGTGLSFYPFNEKFIEICQILKEGWNYVPIGTSGG